MFGYNDYRQTTDPAAQAAYDANQQRLAAQAAWEAQQKAYGQSTNANFNALQDELNRNDAEIAQLKKELVSLTTELGDQDNVDRTLAANRARIGDMGNSRAHQADIQNRFQWRWQNNEAKESDYKKQLKNEAKESFKKLDELRLALTMSDNSQRPELERQIRYYTNELKNNPYGAEYLKSLDDNVPSGVPSGDEGGAVRSLDDVNNYILQIRTANKDNPYKNNGLTAQNKKDILAIIDSLPKEVQALPNVSKLRAEIENETTIETAKANYEVKVKRQKSAIADAKKNVDRNKLAKDGKYDYTYTDTASGKTETVNVTLEGNTIKYKCGKQTDTGAM